MKSLLAFTALAFLAAGPGHDETTCLTSAFNEWAASSPQDKTRFELSGVAITVRPEISIPYARSHFSGYQSKQTKICPSIQGRRCTAPVDGIALTFAFTVGGLQLPGGTIEFTKQGQIVSYDGPAKEFTQVLTPAEAQKRGAGACDNRQLKLEPSRHDFIVTLKPWMSIEKGMVYGASTPTYTRGVLQYRFGMSGHMPGYAGALCTVDAVTGAAEFHPLRLGGVPRN